MYPFKLKKKKRDHMMLNLTIGIIHACEIPSSWNSSDIIPDIHNGSESNSDFSDETYCSRTE